MRIANLSVKRKIILSNSVSIIGFVLLLTYGVLVNIAFEISNDFIAKHSHAQLALAELGIFLRGPLPGDGAEAKAWVASFDEKVEDFRGKIQTVWDESDRVNSRWIVSAVYHASVEELEELERRRQEEEERRRAEEDKRRVDREQVGLQGPLRPGPRGLAPCGAGGAGAKSMHACAHVFRTLV